VGIEEASKNLYLNYGPEVLRAIQGEILSAPSPKPVEVDSNDLTKEFQSVFHELSQNLP
jgi:hypothetical protein